MPIYEYQCAHCGARFEKLVRNAAQSQDTLCPECGLGNAKRLLSTFAARMGGSRTECAAASTCPSSGSG
jgi:putative FmdB family regulatory protein